MSTVNDKVADRGKQGLSLAKQGDRRKEVYRSVGSISHHQSKSAKEKKARAC
jgi:hypothetical protein